MKRCCLTQQARVCTVKPVESRCDLAIDGFAALSALSKRPEIDISKVGVTGFSRGGVVAMFTQDQRLDQAMEQPALEFAAHLPFYPGCAITFDRGVYGFGLGG